MQNTEERNEEEMSFMYYSPEFKSILIINKDFRIAMFNKMPCKFHRLMQKIFFGIEWKEYKEE